MTSQIDMLRCATLPDVARENSFYLKNGYPSPRTETLKLVFLITCFFFFFFLIDLLESDMRSD